VNKGAWRSFPLRQDAAIQGYSQTARTTYVFAGRLALWERQSRLARRRSMRDVIVSPALIFGLTIPVPHPHFEHLGGFISIACVGVSNKVMV
jgi:hypothetical protein